MKYFGVSYYPELYPEKDRDKFILEDMELMKKAGFNVVRMAEFTWCLMEPREGEYRFGWLESTINLLGENGIFTVLCTPTACPPVWMMRKHPDIGYVDNYGIRRSYGGRCYSCRNNPHLIHYTERVCEAIGQRFGDHPYVLGFQIDNELAGEHSGRCHCPVCQDLFRKHLAERFDNDIAALNEAFGMLNWGQCFDSFDAIEAPAVSSKPLDLSDNMGWQGTNHPSLRLAFDRFSSERQVAYFRLQRDILQKYTTKTITTNTTHFAVNNIDYYDLAKECKTMGVDHYPDAIEENKVKSGMIYGMSRGYKDCGFWLLETLCGGGHGNWAYQGMAHLRPGALRQNLVFAFASGADLVTMFKFGVFSGGFEQLGSALIDLDRIPGRRYEEAGQAGKDLEEITPLLESTTIKSDVAIVIDYSDLWGHIIKPIAKDFRYTAYIEKLHGQLVQSGINVDIIGSGHDLSPYQLVILPFAPILPGDFAEKCKAYVAGGGNVAAVCMPFSRSGWGNGIYAQPPVSMVDVFGARVEEAEPVFEGRTDSMVHMDGLSFSTQYWQEVLQVSDACVLGSYGNTYRKGLPIITENSYGAGKALYVGTAPCEKHAAEFWNKILDRYQIPQAPVVMQEGVTVITRTGEESTCYFVFNAKDTAVAVELKGGLTDYGTGKDVQGCVEIPHKGWLVLREKQK